jgi:hypothetical protein
MPTSFADFMSELDAEARTDGPKRFNTAAASGDAKRHVREAPQMRGFCVWRHLRGTFRFAGRRVFPALILSYCSAGGSAGGAPCGSQRG